MKYMVGFGFGSLGREELVKFSTDVRMLVRFANGRYCKMSWLLVLK